MHVLHHYSKHLAIHRLHDVTTRHVWTMLWILIWQSNKSGTMPKKNYELLRRILYLVKQRKTSLTINAASQLVARQQLLFVASLLKSEVHEIDEGTVYSGNLNEQIHYAPQESERSVFTQGIYGTFFELGFQEREEAVFFWIQIV